MISSRFSERYASTGRIRAQESPLEYRLVILHGAPTAQLFAQSVAEIPVAVFGLGRLTLPGRVTIRPTVLGIYGKVFGMGEDLRAATPSAPSGSRAQPVRVGCYAGRRYPERPEWVEMEGRKVEVQSVESEWREEDRLGFLVTLRDSGRMLLYYVPNHDLWSGVLIT